MEPGENQSISREKSLYAIGVIVLLCVVCGESVAFSVYNKYLFSGVLKTPVLYTATCQFQCFAGSVAIWACAPGSFYKRTPIDSTAAVLKILLIPIAFVMNYGMNNLSLEYTTLALNQLIRSFAPVVVALTSFFIEGKVQTWPKAISLGFLVLGVIMGVGTSPDFEILGIMICAGSLLGQALGIVMTAFVMGDKTVRLQPMDVLLYTTLPSVVVLVPWAFAIGEFSKLQTALDRNGFGKTLFLIFCGGVLAFTYTLFYVMFIKLTSSVYYGVTGGFRCTLAIIMSFYFFPQRITTTGIAGIVIAMTAFITNSYFTMRGKLAEKDKKVEEMKQPLLNNKNQV
ncbi:hypothetical protein AAMO2058_000971200 [Amorphochlora amoebiformis]